MNKLLLIGLILVVVMLSGCIYQLTGMEVDTSEKNCRNKTSGDSILIKPMIDMICDDTCRPDLYTYTHGHTYHDWECSDKDTIVCVCNR